MGALKRMSVGAVAASLLAVPVRAGEDLPRVFANCAGQYSAMMEHAWLMQDPRADEFAGRRASFLSLLEATADATDPLALSRRIEAKAAQASLLREAAFGTDADRAKWASHRAEAQLATCKLLLLGG